MVQKYEVFSNFAIPISKYVCKFFLILIAYVNGIS